MRWLTITSFGRIDGLGDPETIPTWMLSKEGRNRVKQRQPIQPVGDAGDMHKGDGGEQVAGEEPAPSRRDPTGRHDSRRLAGGKPPTTGAD